MLRIFLPVVIVFCLAGIFISCKKKEREPEESFSWRINGGAEQFSDTTNFLSLFSVNTIYGKKGSTNVYINTNSTNMGIYSMASGNAGFGVTLAGIQYNSTSGSIQISSNADRRLAGNYTATLVDGTGSTTISLEGNFSNIQY